MPKVKIIAVVELTYETGPRSRRAWIDNEVVPPIAEDVKAKFSELEKSFAGVGSNILIDSRVTIASPV